MPDCKRKVWLVGLSQSFLRTPKQDWESEACVPSASPTLLESVMNVKGLIIEQTLASARGELEEDEDGEEQEDEEEISPTRTHGLFAK